MGDHVRREEFSELVEAVEILLEKVREVRERQRLLGEEIETVKETVQGLRRRINKLEEKFRRLQAEAKALAIREDEEFFRAYTRGGDSLENGSGRIHERVLECRPNKAGHRPLEKEGNV